MSGLRERLDNHLMESRAEVPNLFLNPDSFLKCDECRHSLGFFRMVFHAIGKKKNECYRVKCKKCGFVNVRKKGALNDEIGERWGRESE